MTSTSEPKSKESVIMNPDRNLPLLAYCDALSQAAVLINAGLAPAWQVRALDDPLRLMVRRVMDGQHDDPRARRIVGALGRPDGQLEKEVLTFSQGDLGESYVTVDLSRGALGPMARRIQQRELLASQAGDALWIPSLALWAWPAGQELEPEPGESVLEVQALPSSMTDGTTWAHDAGYLIVSGGGLVRARPAHKQDPAHWVAQRVLSWWLAVRAYVAKVRASASAEQTVVQAVEILALGRSEDDDVFDFGRGIALHQWMKVLKSMALDRLDADLVRAFPPHPGLAAMATARSVSAQLAAERPTEISGRAIHTCFTDSMCLETVVSAMTPAYGHAASLHLEASCSSRAERQWVDQITVRLRTMGLAVDLEAKERRGRVFVEQWESDTDKQLSLLNGWFDTLSIFLAGVGSHTATRGEIGQEEVHVRKVVLYLNPPVVLALRKFFSAL